MNYFIVSVFISDEIVKKIFESRDRVYLNEIENIKDLIERGFTGKVYSGGEIEEFYFDFFTGGKIVSPAVLKCYYYGIEIKESQTPFLAKFLTHYDGVITRTNIDLTEEEKKQLLDDLKNDFDFQYFLKGEDIIIILNERIPYLNLPYPEEIEGKNLKKILPMKKEFVSFKEFISGISESLEKNVINEIRKDLNQPVANLLYLWGNGEIQKIKNIKEITEKNCYFIKFGEEKYEEVADIIGFDKIDDFDFSKESCLFWITFVPSEKSVPVQLRKLGNFDKKIVGEIVKLKGFKIIFFFEGENEQTQWLNYIYYSDGEKKGIKKKIKNKKYLFEKFFYRNRNGEGCNWGGK